MELVETRDLDGPNLFALYPVIKLELSGVEPGDQDVAEVAGVMGSLHQEIGLPSPEVGILKLDQAGHVALFYPWQWRSASVAIARQAFASVNGAGVIHDQNDLRGRLERDRREQDVPLWVRDAARRKFTIGVTGTNGKTTTTRLLAHIARCAGKHAGWSSSTGVYVDGECIIEGDYTGPSGARAVFEDLRTEIAILETARGGLLLRGAGYESNDVGIFLNVSADHLAMQGVETLETLASVKSVVIRVTRPEGVVVLNADDPLVAAYQDRVRARVMLFGQQPDSGIVSEHLRGGGRAVLEIDGRIVVVEPDGTKEPVAVSADLPMTYGGTAVHMAENALAGTAGALAAGFSVDQIREGLRSFRSDSTLNPGRLNVFDVQGAVVVVDYAHNEDGLRALIRFSRGLIHGTGQLNLVVGTAGDRQDSVLEGLGLIAASLGDRVLLKDTPRYRRGRASGEMIELMRRGANGAHQEGRLAGSYPDEFSAICAAIDGARPGDVIAIMCQEEQVRIVDEIRRRGGVERT